jgi:DNA-directed RNA polymerase subunit L|tara:strand:- start:573 stop:827 length:255 start_codon:yes stop_codon:yes gene_type:complete
MEVKILKEDKTSMDIEISSLTIAEVLRNYLNKEGAKLAAWRREHPTKNPVLHIESDNPKKLLKKAISEIEKETDKVVEEFKKLI